ncbi:MAG: hypothetical protein A2V81_02795 [Candidatus Abawacabacteria bacterium RBG_16_42_10]|uniref:Alpha/beta hydrolase n=1 Tax=Candidatus Abawacabacteria bacterium RBG_16_42_10 TaxID=1817814 RepID=A0A1F4XK83_9BACT|nr:MAG: hypothetical protein A2V81_02795 [Candidatus Abawacabacteria bacterium RBG_16_42_10]
MFRCAQHDKVEYMNLILLPGNSRKSNEQWIKDVAEAVKDSFTSNYIHTYQHWQEEEGGIDYDMELTSLVEEVKKFDTYAIFAKSAGAILAMIGIDKGLLHPQKCIFTGTAIAFAQSLRIDIEAILQRYQVPTLFIQKTDDPAYPFLDLKDILIKSKTKNYELLEIPGYDHDYNDIAQLKELIVNFLLPPSSS